MEGAQLTVVVAAALHRSSMASKDVTMTMCSGGIGSFWTTGGGLGGCKGVCMCVCVRVCVCGIVSRWVGETNLMQQDCKCIYTEGSVVFHDVMMTS